MSPDMNIYFVMAKEVGDLSLTVAPTGCGTQTTTARDDHDPRYWDWSSQTNRPVVTVTEGQFCSFDNAYWLARQDFSNSSEDAYTG